MWRWSGGSGPEEARHSSSQRHSRLSQHTRARASTLAAVMEGESMVPSTVRIVHLVYVCTFGARLRMRARERRRREEERLHQRVGGSLSQQDQRQALHVFGETASVRAESIHELRKAMRIVVEAQEADDWRDVQVASEQSEAWLLRFVRFTRFDVQRALETLRAGMAHARYLETLPYRTGGQFVVQGEAESPPPRVSFWELSLGHPAVEHVTRAGIVQLVPGRARDGSAVVLLTLSNAFLEAWQIYPVGVCTHGSHSAQIPWRPVPSAAPPRGSLCLPQIFTLAVDKCLELVSLDEVSQLYGLTVVLDMRRASLKLMSVSARARSQRTGPPPQARITSPRRATRHTPHAPHTTRATRHAPHAPRATSHAPQATLHEY
jgi:hypothetical protein